MRQGRLCHFVRCLNRLETLQICLVMEGLYWVSCALYALVNTGGTDCVLNRFALIISQLNNLGGADLHRSVAAIGYRDLHRIHAQGI